MIVLLLALGIPVGAADRAAPAPSQTSLPASGRVALAPTYDPGPGVNGAQLDFQRWYWAYRQRADPVLGIPPGAYQRAFEQMRSLKNRPHPGSSTQNGQFWASIGPAPLVGGQINSPVPADVKVSGRITGIAVDPVNSNHWYAASAGGGIWETTDTGTTWTPRTDDQLMLGMCALAIPSSHPNVIYGAAQILGSTGGILSSTNGGLSWTLHTPASFSNEYAFNFTGLIVSPTDPSTLLACAWELYGEYYNLEPGIGIFKSTNGGASWLQKIGGVGTDLRANPGDFNLQYAALRAACSTCNGISNGVYRSFDAGNTWQTLSGPWGSITNNSSPLLLALPPSDTNVAYLCVSGAALWRTTNAWAGLPNWMQLPLPSAELDVSLLGSDPINSQVLYAGGVRLWRFDATNWSDITGSTHVDQHALAWAGGRMLLGNDGGFWSSLSSGSSWSNHNAQLGTLQFYRGSLHSTNANFALAGSQDNGTESWVGTNTWQFLYGGDGQANAIAATQPNKHWALSAQGLWIMRTLNGWASSARVDGGIESVNRPFYSLFVESPFNDDVFITATYKMWKTTNFFSGTTVQWFTNGPDMGTPITAMAFAPSDMTGSTYAFGTQNGDLRLTQDGGNTWTNLDTGNRVPNRSITGLAFAQSTPNLLFITLSGFDSTGSAGHVFKTANALASNPVWVNVSPPVNLPHNTIALDGVNGDSVFVGTDIGVWRSTNAGASWVHMGPEAGLPNVVVNDLELNPANGRLVAFTYGRGAFALVNTTNVANLSFTAIQLSGLDVVLTFKTVLGHSYLVEGADLVSGGAWFTVADNVPGTGNPVSVRDAGGAAHPERFYRVSASP